jgi:hypothetical protein
MARVRQSHGWGHYPMTVFGQAVVARASPRHRVVLRCAMMPPQRIIGLTPCRRQTHPSDIAIAVLASARCQRRAALARGSALQLPSTRRSAAGGLEIEDAAQQPIAVDLLLGQRHRQHLATEDRCGHDHVRMHTTDPFEILA